jgi:hypothetical protein
MTSCTRPIRRCAIRLDLDVPSYVVLERIYRESFGLSCPDFADVFIGRQAFESFKTLGEVVGLEDRMQMRFQMIV